MRGRIALVVALVAVLLDLWGALLTTNRTLTVPSASRLLSPVAHQHAAMGLGGIAVVALVWFAITEKRMAKLAWVLVLGFVLVGAFGFAELATLHATLAHALVAGTAALALAASSAWSTEPEFVRDYGWPSMRSLAIAVPALTLVQAALGAAFRQQVLGLMPHIGGAFAISLLILMLGAFVINQFPQHPRLRLASRAMLATMFTQVFLGVAAYTVRSIPSIDNVWALAIVGGHVITGALTVAATAVLGMLIRREVLPKL